MKVYQTKDIRNVALIGAAKSGKTSIAEAMMFETGIINRLGNIEDKNTVSDYRPIELDKKNSVSSTVLCAEHKGKKINIIDTPGFPGYRGDVFSALSVADAAVIVVNAQNETEIGTERKFRWATKHNLPTIFVVNHLDHDNINFDNKVSQLKGVFKNITLVQYPVNAGPDFDAFIDVLQMKMFKYTDGKMEVLEIPESEMEKAKELHGQLVESAAEGDDSLMEKFFESDSLSEEEILQGLRIGLLNREVFPLLVSAAKRNIGSYRILDFISNNVPSPDQISSRKTVDGEKELTCKADDPTALFIFKTSKEHHLGEVSFFKVFGGEISEGMDMISSNRDTKERFSQIMVMCGKNREKVDKMVAGDIGATIKLKDVKTNSTLCDAKNNIGALEPIVFPEPFHIIAMNPVNSADDEKMGAAINEVNKVDPTIQVEFSRELKQTLVKGYGDLHIKTLKWYLDNEFKVETEIDSPKIAYRETITKSAKSDYRHKKQSGGSGQFGEVYMMIEPYIEGMENQTEFPVRKQEIYDMEWGGKLVLNNCIVGGSIDVKYFPAIYKGLMERMEQGPLTGSYARDIVVNVYDGKMHPVDSNEISFKLAARHAFSAAFKQAGPKIMEPISLVEVFVPEDKMGDTMTDLQGRRAIIEGMEGEGKYQRLKAKVPLAEMDKYATCLSSITSGKGEYSMIYDSYQPVPGDVQIKLLKTYEEEQEEE